jgi:hypothetical protein
MNSKGGEEAGPVFVEFIVGELKFERERRSALDQRGITAVTSSSTLVTLLSGLVALVGIKGGVKPSIVMVAVLTLSLLCFVLAASFGIATNRSRPYTTLDESSLRSLRDDDAWTLPANEARMLIYGEHVKMLVMIRSGNNRKSAFVNLALRAQLLALSFLAITIIIGLGAMAVGS